MPPPDLVLSPAPLGGWPPDPLIQAQAYRDITLLRMLAYAVDVLIIATIGGGVTLTLWLLTLATLGLLWPLHFLLAPFLVALPLLYHGLQIGSPAAATIGMRVFGLKVWSITDGPPSLAQALVQTAGFYATLAFFGGLLLLVALFNPQRRALHDLLAGTIILRKIGG
ncbi:MAG TPA: RDD family protein [Patescibacteria group bacterium]|nr:RDD family protein [Patescibacteria group bacterium]